MQKNNEVYKYKFTTDYNDEILQEMKIDIVEKIAGNNYVFRQINLS